MCKTETKTPPKPGKTPGNSDPKNGAQTNCHPVCTLTSKTIATSPADRARTKIGVGEEVELTVKGNPATWAITSGTGTLSPNTGARRTVTFTADDKAGSTTITATGSGCSCVNTITFTIVRPASWTMKRKPGSSIKHTNGKPDCGFLGIMYVHPNDVNFYRVETREKDSLSVATGCYNPSHHGKYHGKYGPPDQASGWFLLTRHTEPDGSTDDVPDEIYSGYANDAAMGTAPPFKVGTMYFPITIQWHVVGNANIHDFPVIRQEHEVFSDGKCETRKGGLTESAMYSDPTKAW